MELITTYRFKWNTQYIGIVSKREKIIRTTPFPQHAIHHSEDEFGWVSEILKDKGFDFTYEKLTHFYTPLKNDK